MMVIVLSKSLVLVASVLFFISGCQASNNKETFHFLKTIEIKKIELELYNKNSYCALRINGSPQGELLDVSYPCGFVRANEKLKAQTYYYEGVGQVFVVAGPIVNEKAYKKDSGVNAEHMCSNQGQAIIIYNDKLTLRQSQNVPLGFCHYLGFDEKNYYGFAYPVN